MEHIKIKVNGRVEVLWKDEQYKTIISDVTEEYIAISIPTRNGASLPLNTNDEFEVLYYDNKNIYKFDGTVIERRIEKNIPLILISYPKRMQLIQRRNFVRVSASVSVEYIKINQNTNLKNIESMLDLHKGKKAIIKNVSGGGMEMKMTEEILPGELIIADIYLEKAKIRVKAQVVRNYKDDIGNDSYGFAFVELDERIREKIIRAIFKIMRKQMWIL